MPKKELEKPRKKNGVGLAAKITAIVYIAADALLGFIFLVLSIVFATAIKEIEGSILAGIYGGIGVIFLVGMFLAIAGLNTSKDRTFSKGIGVANCVFNTPLGVLILVARSIENNDY